jgi:type II secretory pathway pseudopilin PulG
MSWQIPDGLTLLMKEVAKMMKSRRMSGVTLLEIMLVLAVAAMVIVMSIRYYRNATNSQNSNVIISQINAMITAGEQIAQGAGGSFSSVSAANISAITGFTTTPFNTTYTVTGATATGYSIGTGTLPTQVCSQIASSIGTTNPKIAATCASGAVTVVYNSTL